VGLCGYWVGGEALAHFDCRSDTIGRT